MRDQAQIDLASTEPQSRLSEREREMMAYVAAHYRSKAIARAFGTAPKTVDADHQRQSGCV